MEASDRELIGRYRGGDVEALSQLVAKHRGPLMGYIVNMTRQRHEADEVFQEVWFRAISKMGSYRQRNFPGWLLRIARNIVIDRARKSRPGISLDAGQKGIRTSEKIGGNNPDPAERAEANDLGQRIAEAVRTLPGEQRETFVLRAHAGLPFKEIARLQKVSINTALARMQYALAKLRPLLKEDYEALRE